MKLNTIDQLAKKIKTPRDAKGPETLKILEKTTASVFQGKLPRKSAENLKHCHSLPGSRMIPRIDRQPWEERVGQILRLYEKHRHNRANALFNALQRINVLLNEAHLREAKLQETTGELESTGNYLQTLLDSMADSLIAIDTNGIITETNRAAERISGYDREEMIGQPFERFFTDPGLARKGIEQVFIEKEISDYELTLVDKFGRNIPVMFNATVLLDLDDEITGVLINARDISDLKRAREAQEMYAKELARANADLEEFASVASHDLQEPLKKVVDHAENLSQRYRDEFDPQAIKDLAFMIDQASYMQELIKNVLAYAQVDTGEWIIETLECEAVLDQALRNLMASIDDSGVEVTRDPLPIVRGEAGQLVRVFQNLVGNAIKYRDPEKAKCWVHVSAVRIEDADIRMPTSALGRGWLFSVRDNGMGIDPDFIEDIFKMFVRLDPDIPGAGLGLAIAEKIVRRHHGDMWVESEPGEGSTFFFTIPDTPES